MGGASASDEFVVNRLIKPSYQIHYHLAFVIIIGIKFGMELNFTIDGLTVG